MKRWAIGLAIVLATNAAQAGDSISFPQIYGRAEDMEIVCKATLLVKEDGPGYGGIPKDKLIDVAYCLGYISGVVDEQAVTAAKLGVKRICLPKKMEKTEIAWAYLQHYNPSTDAMVPASVLMMDVMMKRWPCNK